MEVTPEHVGLHDTDTDSSQLSVSTSSNTMLPYLEPTDAEERGKKEARKLKRAAREKKSSSDSMKRK
jgi:hypothetical protein